MLVGAAGGLLPSSPMDHSERVQLLAELYRGATSRNRAFERFRDPRARQVLGAHRRLRGLIADMQGSDARVTARWSRDGRTLMVECRRPRLRYCRQLTLTEWEAAFLLQTPVGTTLAALAFAPA